MFGITGVWQGGLGLFYSILAYWKITFSGVGFVYVCVFVCVYVGFCV